MSELTCGPRALRLPGSLGLEANFARSLRKPCFGHDVFWGFGSLLESHRSWLSLATGETRTVQVLNVSARARLSFRTATSTTSERPEAPWRGEPEYVQRCVGLRSFEASDKRFEVSAERRLAFGHQIAAPPIQLVEERRNTLASGPMDES